MTSKWVEILVNPRNPWLKNKPNPEEVANFYKATKQMSQMVRIEAMPIISVAEVCNL